MCIYKYNWNRDIASQTASVSDILISNIDCIVHIAQASVRVGDLVLSEDEEFQVKMKDT